MKRFPLEGLGEGAGYDCAWCGLGARAHVGNLFVVSLIIYRRGGDFMLGTGVSLTGRDRKCVGSSSLVQFVSGLK